MIRLCHVAVASLSTIVWRFNFYHNGASNYGYECSLVQSRCCKASYTNRRSKIQRNFLGGSLTLCLTTHDLCISSCFIGLLSTITVKVIGRGRRTFTCIYRVAVNTMNTIRRYGLDYECRLRVVLTFELALVVRSTGTGLVVTICYRQQCLALSMLVEEVGQARIRLSCSKRLSNFTNFYLVTCKQYV